MIERKNMKLRDILMIYETIKQIINDTNIINFKVKFKLLNIEISLEKFVLSFEQIKNEKIKEYGVIDESGNFVVNKDDTETINKITSELDLLLDDECDYSPTLIDAEEIFNCGINAEYLTHLLPLIKGCE